MQTSRPLVKKYKPLVKKYKPLVKTSRPLVWRIVIMVLALQATIGRAFLFIIISFLFVIGKKAIEFLFQFIPEDIAGS